MNGFGENLSRLARPVGKAMLGALIAMSIVYFIGTELFDATMEIDAIGELQTVTFVSSLVFTVLTVIVGGLVATALATYTSEPSRNFLIVSLVVFALMSFPAGTGDADTSTKLTLLTMHIAVIVPVLLMLLPALQRPVEPVTADDIKRQLDARG